MASASTTRNLSLVGVTLVALLSVSYALGRSLGPDGSDPTRPVAAAPVPEPPPHATAGDQPANPQPTADSQPTTAQPTPDGAVGPRTSAVPDPDLRTSNLRAQLPAEEDGPYGSRMTTGSREVALTFDDGPDPHYTPQTLALLRKHQVKATFCLIGTNVRRYPELVREIVADGHTLCNHSWDHDITLGSRSRQVIEADLMNTNEAIRKAVPGARIAYYRQPGGNWTYGVVAVARELGMTSLHWAVDPQDWTVPGAGSIYATVTADTAAGDIVLLHDAGGNRAGTVAALRSILPNLNRRFYLEALPTGPALRG
jgi:peptidoglycan/xylan/chitin deacetylase (PgdA/CDA1 family)